MKPAVSQLLLRASAPPAAKAQAPRKDTTMSFLSVVGERELAQIQAAQMHAVQALGSPSANPSDVVKNEARKVLDAVEEEAGWIKELQDDWNDDGAPAVTEYAWSTALRFLDCNVALFATRHQSHIFPAPSVAPVAHQGIDLYWESDKGMVLAHIPLESTEAIQIYSRSSEYGTVQQEIPPAVSEKSVESGFFVECIAKTVS